MSLPPDVLRDFPKLANSSATKTSPAMERYNCAAYAVGDKMKRWWPGDGISYWPNNMPETIENFVGVFKDLGFAVCGGGEFEKQTEKLALFVMDGVPQHVAIQRTDRSGLWRSKLGRGVDIEHELADLEGDVYGVVAMFFRRKKQTRKGKKRGRG